MSMFSVIVPTHNRHASLRNTIESLLRQDHADYEIIIVDDGSTDGTSSFLQNLQATPRLRIVSQSNQGPAAARNAGLAVAKGNLVAFTDDDCVVPPDWLRRYEEVMGASQLSFAGGLVRNCIPNIFSDVSQEITNHFVRFFGAGGQTTTFLTSNNVVYRAEKLKALGGFDARFRGAGGEERALHARIISAGGQSKLVPNLVIDHYHDLTLQKFCRQQMRYGRGSYLMYHVAGGEMTIPPRRIPPRAYLTLIAFLMHNNSPLRGIAAVFLYVLSQVMVTAGYVLEAAAHSKRRGR